MAAYVRTYTCLMAWLIARLAFPRMRTACLVVQCTQCLDVALQMENVVRSKALRVWLIASGVWLIALIHVIERPMPLVPASRNQLGLISPNSWFQLGHSITPRRSRGTLIVIRLTVYRLTVYGLIVT